MPKVIERRRYSKTKQLLTATAALTANETKSRQLGVRVSEGVWQALQAAGTANNIAAGTVASLLLSAYLLPEALGERVNISNADIAELPKLLQALQDAEQVSRSTAEATQALREVLASEGAKIAALAMYQTDQFKTAGKLSLKLQGAPK